MSKHLNQLENESVYVIREAYKLTRNLALLWSMGKDSTVLMHLVRKAFLGSFPIPVLHIDTSYKIPEMISWRDRIAKESGFRLIVGKNEQALDAGMGPERGKLTCCGALKTQALLDAVRSHDIQALLVGIRGDEEGSRGKERVVSPRPDSATWIYKDQPAELHDYYNFHVPEGTHLRVHPLLHWTELDVWDYIQKEKLEVIPLYFSRDGKRYRSIGCSPCTGTVESQAATVADIVIELKNSRTSERSGRAQDKADPHAMQILRQAGYM